MSIQVLKAKNLPLLKTQTEDFKTANPTFFCLGAPFYDTQYNQILATDEFFPAGSLPAGSATAANQVLEIAQLTGLNAKDYATETTLAAVLAKIIASPATEATLALIKDQILASLPNLDVTLSSRMTEATGLDIETGVLQTRDNVAIGNISLAAILAKIIAAPATEAKQYAQRPSEKTGRTHLDIVGGSGNANTTAHTVTVGKTFYATSIALNGNASVATAAYLGIRDGGAGGTLKILTNDILSLNGTTQIVVTFEEPKQFVTDVFINRESGTFNRIHWSITGYEEDN